MLDFPSDFPTDEAKVVISRLRSGVHQGDARELFRCGWVMVGYALDQMLADGEPDPNAVGAGVAMDEAECADFLEAQCAACENPAKAGRSGAAPAGAFDWMAALQILLPLLQQLFQRNRPAPTPAPARAQAPQQQGGQNPATPPAQNP